LSDESQANLKVRPVLVVRPIEQQARAAIGSTFRR
jgi:hypothetical protein